MSTKKRTPKHTKGARGWFQKQKRALLFFGILSLLFTIAGLFVIVRVQTKVQKRLIRLQGVKILRYLAADCSTELHPETVRHSRVEKFFLLQTLKKYDGKLFRFKFLQAFDRRDPKAPYRGLLEQEIYRRDPRYRRLHDLAAQAIVRRGPVVEFENSRGKNPKLVMAMAFSTGDVGIVVRPVDIPPPAIPWLGLLVSLSLAFVVALLVPAKLLPLGGVLVLTIAYGLLVGGYRITPMENGLALFSSGIEGLTQGYFPLVWALLSLLGLAAGVLWFSGHVGRFFSTIKANRIAYTYVLPAMAGMLVLVLLPFVIGMGLGFVNHCNGKFEFIGLANFWEILSGGGASITNPLNFYFTLGVTLLWTFINVVLHVSIGLGLALLLKDPALKMKGVYRVLLIIPWAMPNYITALMWKGMFQQQYGAINILLDTLGIGGISWFSSFWPSFMANVITNTWLGFPFMMVVSLGALQSIPSSLYEAAEVDGASKWQQFQHVTLPLLRPALFPSIVLGSIWTFNMFNIIYLVSGGEPGGATDILITEAYQWAFKRGERYGLAAAYAVLIFVVLLLYSKGANKLTRASEDLS